MSTRAGLILCAHRKAGNPVWKIRTRKALELKGNIPDAADKLGISEHTLRRWVRENPEVREGLPLRGVGQPSRASRAPHSAYP